MDAYDTHSLPSLTCLCEHCCPEYFIPWSRKLHGSQIVLEVGAWNLAIALRRDIALSCSQSNMGAGRFLAIGNVKGHLVGFSSGHLPAIVISKSHRKEN